MPRPQVVRRLITKDWTSSAALTAEQAAGGAPSLGFRGFYGKYSYEVTAANGRTFRGTVDMPATSGMHQEVSIVVPLMPGAVAERLHGRLL